MREYVAEFAGVAVFVIMGTGGDCQVVLSTDPAISSSPKGVSRVSPEKVACIKSALFLELSLCKFRLGYRSCIGRMG
jgi:glycerol uptake facilitator-like aquaporin